MALTNGATLTTLDNILKEFYLPPVVEQLNNNVLLLSRIESTAEGLYGREAVVPLHTGRTSGIGAAGEGQALPTSGNQVYTKATYKLQSLYGRLQVTGQSMIQTKTDAGAFIQSLNSEMDGLQNDLKKDLARQVYGNGDGIIVLCTAGTNVNVIPVASDEPLRKGQIYVNQVIDLRDNTGALITNGGARVVTAVSVSGKTVTVSGSANLTPTTSTSISRAGAISGASVYEMNGIKNVIPTSANTFGGIDATQAANSFWDNQRGTVSGALTLDSMNQAWNTVRFQGGDVSAMYTTLGVQRAYAALLQSQVRFADPMTLKGGYTALSFNNQPLVADIDAPFGAIYFCDEKHLKFFSPQDWQWLNQDGHILKWVIGYDAWEAAMARYINLGADRRNTFYVLSGITDATGV